MPSSSSIDPAMLRVLSLSPGTAAAAAATIQPHGGSGFSSTARITIPAAAGGDNKKISYFVKTSRSPGSDVMFRGEHASLNAIHSVVPSLCPRSIGWGPVESGSGGYFLITDFLELNPRESTTHSQGHGQGSSLSLAQKLAKLHSTPAPIPEGYKTPQFGFPVTTCCGDTPQRNTFASSWAYFFAQHRLLMVVEANERNNGPDAQLRTLVQQVVDQVVPRLLGDGHLGGKHGIVPVVVHGDLWAGNKGKARFAGRHDSDGASAIEEVIYDPSSCYAHNEYEFGIMRMFGGFNTASFWQKYHDIVPKTDPASEFEDRCALYESYHHLNHSAIFGGGGYKSSGMGILRQLVRKYGGRKAKDAESGSAIPSD